MITRFLRRLYWRVMQFVYGFLEGERLWGRVRLIVMFSLILLPLLIGVFIEMPVQHAASEAFYARYPFLTGIPEPAARFLAVSFSYHSLRYVLITFFAISTAMLVGASYVQDVYELKNYWSAMRYLIASMFSVGYPVLHIAEGKKQLRVGEVNTLAEIGGPGLILISPGSAVLFERLNHPSNVRAAGWHFISRFESIKEIIDLSDQLWYVEKLQCMSKDGLLVNVHDLYLRFRLWGSHREGGATGRNPVIPYPYSTQAVRNLVYNRPMRMTEEGLIIPPWGMVVQLAVDSEIQNYIRKNPVDVVTAPEPGKNPREEIKRAIMSTMIRGNLRNVGTELVWLDIGHFSVEDPKVEEQRIQTWGSRWEGEADLLRAKGDAARHAMLERARAEAQAELLNRIAEALRELDPDLLHPDHDRVARLFLLKIMQVLDELRRHQELPPTTSETA